MVEQQRAAGLTFFYTDAVNNPDKIPVKVWIMGEGSSAGADSSAEESEGGSAMSE